MREKILNLIEKRGDLPAFPDIIIKLQKVLDNPDTNISDIAKLIEMDPILSGNILRVANSALYRSRYQDIYTLRMAVNKLGLEKIRQLVFSLKISKLFDKVELINPLQFWKHALAVANFTQMLSRYTDVSPNTQNIAHLSGLMHDIGIMVMCYLIPDEYARFLKNLSKEDIPLQKQEIKAFDIDHQEVGATFIEKWWKVDPQIIQAVRYHHFPFTGTEKEKLCQQLVHLANGICVSYGQSNGVECFSEVFNPGAWEALGLSLDDVEKMMDDVQVSVNQAMELLG